MTTTTQMRTRKTADTATPAANTEADQATADRAEYSATATATGRGGPSCTRKTGTVEMHWAVDTP